MVKKKSKKKYQHKKNHEPTAMELAFIKAGQNVKQNQYNKNEKKNNVISNKSNPNNISTSIKSIESNPGLKNKKQTNILLTKNINKTTKKPQPNKINKKKKETPVNLNCRPKSDNSQSLNIDSTNNKQIFPNNTNYNIKTNKIRTQVHNDNYDNESDIVIGVDFGTSSSKIVIRDSGRQTAYAVPFDDLSCRGNPYLIPTNIFVNERGDVSLSDGIYSYDNLKTYFLDNPQQCIFESKNFSQEITALELVVAYIALIIRFSRNWFLDETENIYKRTHIHWHINLGIPSESYDNIELKNIFEDMTLAAWKISLNNDTISIFDIKNVINTTFDNSKKDTDKTTNNLHPEWIHPDFINAHPEVIMELVGYVRSPLRTEGLHLLIDIGATTLDVATFVIHSRNGEDVFSLLKTKVDKYGTMILHNKRITELKNNLEQILKKKKNVDPTISLPEYSHYIIKSDCNNISKIDKNFFSKCESIISEVIYHTKACRDPYSSVWDNGLPTFICGGGGRNSSYLSIIDNISKINKLIIKNIPKPEQLHAPNLSQQDYDRMAVAYGLSFTIFEIGEIVPESKIQNIHKEERKKKDYSDNYISKEMC